MQRNLECSFFLILGGNQGLESNHASTKHDIPLGKQALVPAI